jgi:flagellar basal body rod protein FlgG
MLRVVLYAILFASPAFADSPRLLRETRDDRHLAVVGDGFLWAEDAEGKSYFLRSCVLAENSEGTLCASLEGELLTIDPRISVPSDAVRVLVGPCGDVSVLSRGQNQRTEIGSLSVAFVRHREGIREIAPGAFICDEHVPPTCDSFGEGSQTFLMQGWIGVPESVDPD